MESNQKLIASLENSIIDGQEWLFPLLSTIGAWGASEEKFENCNYRYLIGGEAFDWLLLAKRLCSSLGELVPKEEQDLLLLHGQLPVTIKENEFQRLIGPTKYRAHLNFVYGVLVEQGLQLTVMEEIIKENISFMKKRSHILNNEVHHRIYGITKSELLKSFQESGLEVNDSREFTYSLFKYRLNNSEPARIASDTRKGLSALHKYRSIARYTPWSEKGVTGYR